MNKLTFTKPYCGVEHLELYGGAGKMNQITITAFGSKNGEVYHLVRDPVTRNFHKTNEYYGPIENCREKALTWGAAVCKLHTS